MPSLPFCGIHFIRVGISRNGNFLQIWIEMGKSLTHWGTHICIANLAIIGSDNGLSPGRRQAIIWTNAGILLTVLFGTNFSETKIGIQTSSLKKIHLKMSSVKWRPFFLGLNVLMKHLQSYIHGIELSLFHNLFSPAVLFMLFTNRMIHENIKF